MKTEDDGITHINVYSRGKTRLGRFLSNFANAPFDHPEDGYFKSVEAYWYWLSTGNDTLRKTYGHQAKKLGRFLGGKDWMDDKDFKRKIKEAIHLKLKNHPEMFKELRDSTLPLTHYYFYGTPPETKVVVPKEGKWIIDFIEDLRNEI